tara:strand:+ start:12116 stop:12598 length:483 start_codon:yes stop_codon:yes gene_type:complete
MGFTTRALALCLAVSIGLMGTPNLVSAQSPEAEGPFSRLAQGLNPANWTMPKFEMPKFSAPSMPSLKSVLPGQDEKQRIVEKKDGLVTEVSKTASSSWTKTKEALNPMKMASWRPFGGDTTDKPEEKSPGFFASLFQGPEPEEARPTTVTDFLGQNKLSP